MMVKEHVYPEEEKMRHIQRRCASLTPLPVRKIYLASPYSARLNDGEPDRDLMYIRFQDVCRVAAMLMNLGYVVFSPIAHSVSIAAHLDNHLDAEFWLKQDFPLIHWCDELWMLMLDGWDQSKGMAREQEYAERLCKPIRFLKMEDIHVTEGWM
jgi:hypothetical protein